MENINLKDLDNEALLELMEILKGMDDSLKEIENEGGNLE